MYVPTTCRGFKVGDKAILDTYDEQTRVAWMDSGYGPRLGQEVEIKELDADAGNVTVKFQDGFLLATMIHMLNLIPVQIPDVYDPIQQLAAAKKKTDDNLREIFGYE